MRATQLFGSHAIATFQGSYHKDRNDVTAPEGIRTINLTCSGGTPDDPCADPPEDNAVSGGYGYVFGASDFNSSERQQYAGGVTLYAGNHEIKVGGDYQDGSSDLLSYYTGLQAVRVQNEYGQLYYSHRFYSVTVDDPTPVAG